MQDFFYICDGHLKDRKFCQPDADEVKAIEARQKKAELDREIEKVKKEHEEKMKRKTEKQKDKDKDKNASKEKEEKKTKDDGAEGEKQEKERDDKKDNPSKADDPSQDVARIYNLNKNFYQMRIDRIKNAEIAKRNRERMKAPGLFPSVPTGDP